MKKIALLFPGQGIRLEPVKVLIRENKNASSVFEKASEAIDRDLVQALDKDNSVPDQALIVTSCVAYFEAFIRGRGLLPSVSYMGGHSLGEYSALICSGVLSLDHGLNLIRQRQKIMDNCTSKVEGTMAALCCPNKDLIFQYLEEVQDKTNDIWISAYNTPGQIVVSGKHDSIKILQEENKYSNLIIKELAINGPLHCPLMASAAKKLEPLLKNIVYNKFQCTVYSSVSGKAYTGTDEINALLTRQLTEPILWEPLINKLSRQQVALFVNMDPSKVLTNMITQFDLSAQSINLTTAKEINRCKAYLKDQIGEYLSPVSLCLTKAVGVRASKVMDEINLEKMESVYDQIRNIWHDTLDQATPASPEQVSESLELLQKIFKTKGMKKNTITKQLEQLIYKTGNRCLN